MSMHTTMSGVLFLDMIAQSRRVSGLHVIRSPLTKGVEETQVR